VKNELKTVKFTPEQATKAQRGSRGRALLSLTTALDGGGWSMPCPSRFTTPPPPPPGKTRYQLYRRLCGPRAGLDECGKSRFSPGFDPRTVQRVARRYTNWAIPAHTKTCRMFIILWDVSCSFTSLLSITSNKYMRIGPHQFSVWWQLTNEWIGVWRLYDARLHLKFKFFYVTNHTRANSQNLLHNS